MIDIHKPAWGFDPKAINPEKNGKGAFHQLFSVSVWKDWFLLVVEGQLREHDVAPGCYHGLQVGELRRIPRFDLEVRIRLDELIHFRRQASFQEDRLP